MKFKLMTAFGCLFIFVMTTLGALLVVFFKGKISRKMNSIFLGFASGIMVASSIWSLIIPSIEESSVMGKWSFIPAVVGILMGTLFLFLLEKIIPTKMQDNSQDLKKCKKLFTAVTIHNIPEGLAVGFAFGTAFSQGVESAYVLAIGLAIGIGLQNFPEGTAVALPVKGVTGSRMKGFLYGTASGVVEPVFALFGYFLAGYISVLQPWLLAFSAGAMLAIVADDLLPDAHIKEASQYATISFIIGFLIMMTLDVALS